MKHIILFSLILCVFISCGSDSDSLKQTVIDMNKNCPIEQKHWTVDSLGIGNNGEIVYFCNTDKDADYFDMLRAKKDSITTALIDNLNTSKVEQSMKLVKLCKKYNAGIVYKYASKNTNEKVIIKIPVNKLVVDPEKE